VKGIVAAEEVCVKIGRWHAEAKIAAGSLSFAVADAFRVKLHDLHLNNN
jgi:hypothetical protein